MIPEVRELHDKLRNFYLETAANAPGTTSNTNGRQVADPKLQQLNNKLAKVIALRNLHIDKANLKARADGVMFDCLRRVEADLLGRIEVDEHAFQRWSREFREILSVNLQSHIEKLYAKLIRDEQGVYRQVTLELIKLY